MKIKYLFLSHHFINPNSLLFYDVSQPIFFLLMTHLQFQIKPLDKSSPEVVKLRPLWKAEPLADGRHGIFLSSHELKAQDSDSRDEELIFCVVRQPYFGYLENISTGWVMHFVFHLDPSLELKKPSLSVCSCRWFCASAFLSDGAEQENYCVHHQPGQGVSLRQPGVQSVRSTGKHRALSHVREASSAQMLESSNADCSFH